MIIDHPNASRIPQLRLLWQEAFGDGDRFLDDFFGTGFCETRCLTLTQGDTLAAALYWFNCSCRGEQAAYVYAVATAKAFRGQGCCHALMERLHRLLTQQGYAMAILVPGSESLFQLYASMGYGPFGGIRQIQCPPGETAVALHPVTAGEYARLRRELLPEGGVVQEGENLAFLQTQAGLYAGNDFLLAAHIAGGCLFAPELLGNTAAAPGIVRAFGCREGRFRAAGLAPFAMYRPLKPCEKPEYFSLAFD